MARDDEADQAAEAPDVRGRIPVSTQKTRSLENELIANGRASGEPLQTSGT